MRKLVATSTPSTPVPALEKLFGGLAAKVSSLEETIDAQSTKLKGLQSDRSLLLQENGCEEHMNNLMIKISTMAERIGHLSRDECSSDNTVFENSRMMVSLKERSVPDDRYSIGEQGEEQVGLTRGRLGVTG